MTNGTNRPGIWPLPPGSGSSDEMDGGADATATDGAVGVEIGGGATGGGGGAGATGAAGSDVTGVRSWPSSTIKPPGITGMSVCRP